MKTTTKPLKKKEKIAKIGKPVLESKKTLSYCGNFRFDNIYSKTESAKKSRLLSGKQSKPDLQLKQIAHEIHLRIKITQQEVFFIGEMLVQARGILKNSGENFESWIEKNFDFGYHTALNFCHVYTACLGQLDLIENVKPSILYTISSPKFPEDLRETLITNDLLKKITSPQIKQLLSDYKEKGHKAVEPLLEEKAMQSLILHQTTPFTDNLIKLKSHISTVASSLEGVVKRDDYVEDRKGATKLGDEINLLIHNFFKKMIDEIEMIQGEVNSKIGTIRELLFNDTPTEPVEAPVSVEIQLSEKDNQSS